MWPVSLLPVAAADGGPTGCTVFVPLRSPLRDGRRDARIWSWRAVAAEPAGPGAFRLVGNRPDGEIWRVPSGSVVTCVEMTFPDGERRLLFDDLREFPPFVNGRRDITPRWP